MANAIAKASTSSKRHVGENIVRNRHEKTEERANEQQRCCLSFLRRGEISIEKLIEGESERIRTELASTARVTQWAQTLEIRRVFEITSQTSTTGQTFGTAIQFVIVEKAFGVGMVCSADAKVEIIAKTGQRIRFDAETMVSDGGRD